MATLQSLDSFYMGTIQPIFRAKPNLRDIGIGEMGLRGGEEHVGILAWVRMRIGRELDEVMEDVHTFTKIMPLSRISTHAGTQSWASWASVRAASYSS